jgi:hypothetical protein
MKLSVIAPWQLRHASGPETVGWRSPVPEKEKNMLLVTVNRMMADNTTRCFGDVRLMQLLQWLRIVIVT